MAYAKTTWTDRNVQFPTRFTLADNGDGTYTLTPSPGTITAAGTPLSKTNLDHLETQYDEAVAVALLKSLFTAAGSLITSTGAGTPAELAKGTARQALQMNAGATALEWVASLAGLLTGEGDLVYASAANVLARLAKGSARQQLAINAGATAPEWVASLQSLLTAAGDIIYASAANTPARLAKGTDGQYLKLAAGLPSWATLVAGNCNIAQGGYTGNDTLSRQIAVGFRPKCAIVIRDTSSIWAIGIDNGSSTTIACAYGTAVSDVMATFHSNGFTTGSAGTHMNSSSYTYKWVAWN